MLPKKLHISNYKCFPSESGGASIELRPLTLFYGYNNSGKSALLRGIALIVQTLLQEKFSMPLSMESSLLRGADFASLLTMDKSAMEFSLSTASGTKMDFSIRNFPDRFTQCVESFSITSESGEIEVSAVLNLDKSELSENKFIYTILLPLEQSAQDKEISFLGLNPLTPTTAEGSFKLWGKLSGHWHPSSQSKQSVVWLSSERASSKRQMAEKSGPINVSEDGSGFEQILHRASFARLPWVDLLQSWLKETFELQISTHSSSKNISICRLPSPWTLRNEKIRTGTAETEP
jgi:hypothetical protein